MNIELPQFTRPAILLLYPVTAFAANGATNDLVWDSYVGPMWSSVFALGVFPILLGIMVVAAVRMALRMERERQTILHPPPGFALVKGRINPLPSGQDEVAKVTIVFKREGGSIRGGQPMSESARTALFRPFSLTTPDGEQFKIRGACNQVDLLTSVVGGEQEEILRVRPGDDVEIFGQCAANGKTLQPGGRRTLRIATMSMSESYAEARNYSILVAITITTILTLIEHTVFGGFFDLALRGKNAVGTVISERSEWRPSHGKMAKKGDGRLETFITVQVANRIAELNYNDGKLGKGDRVPVLITPATMGPGHRPTSKRSHLVYSTLILAFTGFMFSLFGHRPPAWRGQIDRAKRRPHRE